MDQLQREYLREARRKAQSSDYFDKDESEEEEKSAFSATDADEDEVDPLDAFMVGINAQVTQENAAPSKCVAEKPQVLQHEADDVDTYYDSYTQPRHSKSHVLGLDDSDEEVYATAKQLDGPARLDVLEKKDMALLPPIDHSKIQYEPFRKHFLVPENHTTTLTNAEIATIRSEMKITVDGDAVPAPVRSFQHLNFDRKLLQTLEKFKLDAPTPIQAQAIPIALSGRDFIGIAKTGSGKTLAFVLPMVRHVMAQRIVERGEGPIGLVLAPTRELAQQTSLEAKKFLAVYNASCAAIYGGVGKWDQVQALKKGVEVLVATPGRLMDLIQKKSVPMTRVTYVVLDEADRMFAMGFEPQVRSILYQVRPSCQTLLFSATFRPQVEQLARQVLTNPIKVTIGHVGQANEDVHQVAIVLSTPEAKWPWLTAQLPALVHRGRVLIFTASKAGCEVLARNVTLQFPTCPAVCLHGDKTQYERMQALKALKTGTCQVLVATDVAARGLDIKQVKTVVNYDVAKTIEIHVHRIGRTGRLGGDGVASGTAYTLVTKHETNFASQLIVHLEKAGQMVPLDLRAILGKRKNNGRGWHEVEKSAFFKKIPEHEKKKEHEDEDEVEMERWSARQGGEAKAARRQGVGFAKWKGEEGERVTTTRTTFVKATQELAQRGRAKKRFRSTSPRP